MVTLTIINLNLLTSRDELQLQPQEVPHLTLRKMTNIMWYEESGPNETFVLIWGGYTKWDIRGIRAGWAK